MLKITAKVTGDRDLKIPLECPCGAHVEVNCRTDGPGTKLRCGSCGAEITLTGDDMRKAQRALDDLVKAFERLGR